MKIHPTRNEASPICRVMICCLMGLSARTYASETNAAFHAPLRLAAELAAEGDHTGAAIEFRRAAGNADTARDRGGLYWAAAFEYWKAQNPSIAERMLDRAEDEAPELAAPALLLRAESAVANRQWNEAAFYAESVLSSDAAGDVRTLAARRLAVARLHQSDIAAARLALERAPREQPLGLEAVNRYARGRNKRPLLGGFLGLIPGLGYFYAGEYANGLRSLLLNGLFIYGMVATAEDDQWGGFAAITFFEITWYSGSMYGGIDACHRYNRRRLEQAAGAVNGGSRWGADPALLPLVELRIEF